MKSNELNLTVGNPGSVILKFAIPILLTTLLQNFYSMIDTMVIGQFLGKQALAGVGSTGCLNFLIIGFCSGMCAGFVIPVAQKYGANDISGLRRNVANCFFVGCAFAIGITFIVCLLCGRILRMMGTPSDILPYANRYIFVIFLGIPITIAYNLLAGILRSIGDSKSPMTFLMMASVINIGFDLVSVLVLHMGVVGPAIATLLAQLFSAILCFYVLKTRSQVFRFADDEFHFVPSIAALLCKMGLPMGLQYSITAIGVVILQAGINSLGTDAVAAVAAAAKINLYIMCPHDALGSSMATYAGQNMGAGKIDRINQGLKAALKIGTIYCILVLAAVYFTAPKLLLIFLKPDEVNVIALGTLFIRINLVLLFFVMLVNVFRYSIQGMGYSAVTVIAGVLEMFARTIIGVVLIPTFGFISSCFASPLAWIVADCFLLPTYFYVIRRTKISLQAQKKTD